jgi:hypothetical protein
MEMIPYLAVLLQPVAVAVAVGQMLEAALFVMVQMVALAAERDTELQRHI